MADYKKNPKNPYVIKVPNKVRKKITMHEKNEKDK